MNKKADGNVEKLQKPAFLCKKNVHSANYIDKFCQKKEKKITKQQREFYFYVYFLFLIFIECVPFILLKVEQK